MHIQMGGVLKVSVNVNTRVLTPCSAIVFVNGAGDCHDINIGFNWRYSIMFADFYYGQKDDGAPWWIKCLIKILRG